jgi:hypothetical protein
VFSQPPLDHCRDVRQLGRPQRLALSDAVPLCQTATAAGRRGVLRDEYRMSLEGGLFAVIRRVRRPHPFYQQVRRVGEHGAHTFSFKIPQVLRPQPEAPTKRRFGEILEKLVDVLRFGSPSKQGDGRRSDHDLILVKVPLRVKPVVPAGPMP